MTTRGSIIGGTAGVQITNTDVKIKEAGGHGARFSFKIEADHTVSKLRVDGISRGYGYSVGDVVQIKSTDVHHNDSSTALTDALTFPITAGMLDRKFTFNEVELVYAESGSVLMDTYVGEQTVIASFGTTSLSEFSSVSMPTAFTESFPMPMPTTTGNGMGKLLGFVKYEDDKKTVKSYQCLGDYTGENDYKDTSTHRHYLAASAARMDQAAMLHLSCSVARGSILSDGNSGQQVVASVPVQAGAGHHVTFEPTVPIECATNLAGISIDELKVSLKDQLHNNLELGGEHFTCTLVISWDE